MTYPIAPMSGLESPVPASAVVAEPGSPWAGFSEGSWRDEIDVHAFILDNAQAYLGDASFLEPPTRRTRRLWQRVNVLLEKERIQGVLDVSQIPSSITAHQPGYIDRACELIVGLQTDAPLKRAIFPNCGMQMLEASLQAYGFALDPALRRIFTRYRKTHNQGVLDAYSEDALRARSSHLITGLPDAYGRGRIIGDYRRVTLYGVDRLLAEKRAERDALDDAPASDEVIRDREELMEQVRALVELAEMAASYGIDISEPAATAREAIQWLYFAYLAAIKEQNGAAMSLGRTSTFLDIYLERDLRLGRLTEPEAQELVDDFVIKLRLVRFLRTHEYDRLFSGDPTFITEAIGGFTESGSLLVTKTSFRFLQTLYNLGPAPEPNLTVLWSHALPLGFKRFCVQVTLDTGRVQYESDDLLREFWGDDAAIACSVSATCIGKQMQFFGARVNLAKCLLYAINGGRDELTGEQIMPPFEPVLGEVLELEQVMARFEHAMDWLARTYVNAMNCIHYMHDKYAYERLEMALHDYDPERSMAFGIAGLSIVVDSLSAIANARVRVVRDGSGLVIDYAVYGDFPKFGNNDDRADRFASEVVEKFMKKLRLYPAYRGAEHTQSVLTLASNFVYGKHTGNSPDGRRSGEPFAPDANPLQGRDTLGLVASALSVAKLPYQFCQDGISLTATIAATALGSGRPEQVEQLVSALDDLFDGDLYHINFRLDPET